MEPTSTKWAEWLQEISSSFFFSPYQPHTSAISLYSSNQSIWYIHSNQCFLQKRQMTSSSFLLLLLQDNEIYPINFQLSSLYNIRLYYEICVIFDLLFRQFTNTLTLSLACLTLLRNPSIFHFIYHIRHVHGWSPVWYQYHRLFFSGFFQRLWHAPTT